MTIIVFIAAITALTCILYIYLQYKHSYWKKRDVLCPKPAPILGNFSDYILMKKSLPENATNLCKKLEGAPLFGAYFGLRPVLVVQDPELIKLILTKDFYYFSSREHAAHSHKETATRNMFFAHGDTWKVLRQNLTPLFSSAKMKNMFHLIASCTRQFEKLLDEETNISDVMEVRALIARFTMDNICACAFGVDAKALDSNESNNPFRNVAEVLFDTTYRRGMELVGRFLWPTAFYALGFKLFPEKSSHFFDNLVINVFKERKWKPSARQDFVDLIMGLKTSKSMSGDSIQNLKDGSHDKISLEVTDELLAAQSFLFFAAGIDTSAGTSSFTLYEIAKHPEIQDRVIAEVDSYLAANDGKVNYECVNDLPFLYQCIEEALRLYPVLGVSTREVYENYTLPNGLTLEKSTAVYLPVFHLHRDPNYFPEPMKFDPDRFSPERRQDIVPYSYLPFGGGPRICIGMRFAKMQMIPGLITILKKYRVELAEDMPRTIRLEPKSIATQSRGGLKLKFVTRDGWENRVYK